MLNKSNQSSIYSHSETITVAVNCVKSIAPRQNQPISPRPKNVYKIAIIRFVEKT